MLALERLSSRIADVRRHIELESRGVGSKGLRAGGAGREAGVGGIGSVIELLKVERDEGGGDGEVRGAGEAWGLRAGEEERGGRVMRGHVGTVTRSGSMFCIVDKVCDHI